MEKKNEWEWCAPKKGDDVGFWLMSGVFVVLWGVSELIGDIYWWASPEFLWGVFLLGVGGSILVKAAQKALGRGGE